MLWKGQIEKLKRREKHWSTRHQRKDVISLSKTSLPLGMRLTLDKSFRSLAILRKLDSKKGNKVISLPLCATSLLILPQMPSRACMEQCMKESHCLLTSMRLKKSDRSILRRQLISLTLRNTKQSISLDLDLSGLKTYQVILKWLIFFSSCLRLCTTMIWLDMVMDTERIEISKGITGETIRTTGKTMEETILTVEWIKIVVDIKTNKILIIHSNRECQEQTSTLVQIKLPEWHLLCHLLLQVVKCSRLELKWPLRRGIWPSLRDFSHLLLRRILILRSRLVKQSSSLWLIWLERRELQKLLAC